MNLYSLTFIYMFLPASVIFYYIMPRKLKNTVLLLISLAFYTLAEPRYLPLLLCCVLCDYIVYRLMESYEENILLRRGLILFVILKAAGLVVLLSSFTPNRELWRPLGVMVYAVTSLGYGLDIYSGQIKPEHNIIDFALFCLFFVKLPAGPLVRWDDMKQQLKEPKASLTLVSEGVLLYIQGLAKKVLLGGSMTAVYDSLASFPRMGQSVVSSWLMVVSLAFAVYFNLSSLCDMARGLGKMFSVDLPRNFYYPYQSRNVTEFVGRFNISVTSFFSAYLPKSWVDDSGKGWQPVFGLAAVTLLWGAWFGFKVNFIIWALYFILFQLLEKLWWGSFLKKLPTLLSRVYTFAVVLMSFVIFAGNSVEQSIGYFKTMLNIGYPPLYTDKAMYIFSSNYVLLAVSFVLCTSLVNMLMVKLRRRVPAFYSLLMIALNTGLLLVTTTFLVV
ncbi:MAG: hypothetical protein RSC64_01500 [Hydrogenoanaerobacterium sp.]